MNALSPLRSAVELAPNTFSKRVATNRPRLSRIPVSPIVLALLDPVDVDIHRQQRAARLQAQGRDDGERGRLGHADRQAEGPQPARALGDVDAAIAVVIEEGDVPLQRGVGGTAARLQCARQRAAPLASRLATGGEDFARLLSCFRNRQDGSEIFASASAAGLISELSTAKSPSATMPTSRLS